MILPDREGISLVEEDGLLKADGTTLGADNGAAIAAMLAVLDDGALIHPPLECVFFTAQEEVGLIGANGLDKSLIQARTMINMDSGGRRHSHCKLRRRTAYWN